MIKKRKNQSEVLNIKQKQAITELTRQYNCSLKDVANKVGINITTLHRWMKKPEFSKALEESFCELKEEVVSEVAASTNNQSLISKVRNYHNIKRIIEIETMTLLKILKLMPVLIEHRDKFDAKDKQMDARLTDLDKNLIDIERDINKINKEIEKLGLLLK